jgi:hypothetical protein
VLSLLSKLYGSAANQATHHGSGLTQATIHISMTIIVIYYMIIGLGNKSTRKYILINIICFNIGIRASVDHPAESINFFSGTSGGQAEADVK